MVSFFTLRYFSLFVVADMKENGEPKSQTTYSVPNGTPNSPENDVAKQAFASIEYEDAVQTKSSVLEVLKKVRGWIGVCSSLLKRAKTCSR